MSAPPPFPVLPPLSVRDLKMLDFVFHFKKNPRLRTRLCEMRTAGETQPPTANRGNPRGCKSTGWKGVRWVGPVGSGPQRVGETGEAAVGGQGSGAWQTPLRTLQGTGVENVWEED